MNANHDRAWNLAGDLLLDDPRDDDDWIIAREDLAARILSNLEAGREPLDGITL